MSPHLRSAIPRAAAVLGLLLLAASCHDGGSEGTGYGMGQHGKAAAHADAAPPEQQRT